MPPPPESAAGYCRAPRGSVLSSVAVRKQDARTECKRVCPHRPGILRASCRRGPICCQEDDLPSRRPAARQAPPVPPSTPGAKTATGEVPIQSDEWFMADQLIELFLAFHANAPFPDFVRWRPAPGFRARPGDRTRHVGRRLHPNHSLRRNCTTSRNGGAPNRRLYSRLNCDALSYPTRAATDPTSAPCPSNSRRASCRRNCF